MRTGVLLRAAAEGLDCVGVALLTPAGAIQRLSHDESGSRAVLERCIQALGPSLAQRVIEQRGTLATVCADCVDGRAAELVAVPVFAADPRPVAIVVALRLDPDPDFVPAALTTLRRIANTLSRRISRQRDASTGLSTWGAFLNRVRILRERAAEPAEVAILYGNIDRLHLLNNAHGMATGDKVIALAALVIRRCVRSARSAICRLSGDRFVVALQGQSLSQGRAVAERIRDQFERDASRIFGSVHALSISWGVVAAETGSRDLEQAVNDAELACRAAKDRGRNRVETFEPNDASMIRRHDDVDALRLLRAALNTERIVVYAQPIVPLQDASLPHGHELLVRLDGDDRIIEPSAFMSAAARYQILPDLDRAVVMRAFRQLRNAAPDTTELPFPVSINICAPTICSEGFVDWLIEQMQRYAVPAAQLTIEITETAAASSLAAVQAVIVRLRPLGVRFAIDDFGTGVNSLSYLKSLSVDCIKLDGSYVRDLQTDARSEALVKAVVQLATGMGIRTVAEHVDSIALRRRLAEIGVHYAQGFAVGRPEPLDMALNKASRSPHQTLLAAG